MILLPHMYTLYDVQKCSSFLTSFCDWFGFGFGFSKWRFFSVD